MATAKKAEVVISIHALAKRATSANIKNTSITANFNPRPRKEGDCGAKMDKEERKYFNPRPRKEGDDSKQAVKRNRYEYFNPRPRKEGDRCHSLSVC